MKKTLRQYLIYLNATLTPEDIKSVAEKTKLSIGTIRNYLNGQIPSTGSGERNSDAILEKSLIIIENKKSLIK